MLCTVLLYAVFLHTADAWPRAASYWPHSCWSLWALISCAFLHWKGRTRLRGQNTAFEQVLKFRTGEHKKTNSSWKDFIFCWNLRKLNSMEILEKSICRTQQHPALNWSFSSSRTVIFLNKFESHIWTRLHILYLHCLLMHRVHCWATQLTLNLNNSIRLHF